MEVDAVAGTEWRAGAANSRLGQRPLGVPALRLAARRADLTNSTAPGGPKEQVAALDVEQAIQQIRDATARRSRSTATPTTHPGTGSESRGPYGRRWMTGIRCPHDRSPDPAVV
jgi:hypothetical protein